MAQPTGTYATNDMIAIREDLSDIIYDISPLEVPFMSMIARVEATATLHEHQTDSLAAAAANAVIEGDDATTDASTATVRLTNHTQISDKVARVTGTARSVTTAGRADEMDYQMLKRGRELKRDMETALLSNKPKVAGDDTTARELAGIGAWITTNDVFPAGGASPTAADGTDARTDATQAALTEDSVKTSLQLASEQGGNPDIIMTGTFNRQIVDTFGAGATKFQETKDDTLRTTFSVYQSSFGSLKIIFDRFQRSRDVLLLDTEFWAMAMLPGRDFLTHDLAKTGDTDRRQILSEYTLESRNEKASGGVFDVTTS